MQGLHLTADLSVCRSGRHLMTDANALVAALLAAVQAAGLQAVSQLAHQFPGSPQQLMEALIALFEPQALQRHRLQRGKA
jgi:hypothetical protein